MICLAGSWFVIRSYSSCGVLILPPKTWFVLRMGVATTTDTTDSVCKSFEMLKNLYGMSVQFVEPMKKENEEKSAILIKSNKVSLKIMLGFEQLCVLYLVTISLFQHFSNNMKH